MRPIPYARSRNVAEAQKMQENLDTPRAEYDCREKLSYNTPRLYIYGHIRDITKTNGGTIGMNDGGGGPDKTQP